MRMHARLGKLSIKFSNKFNSQKMADKKPRKKPKSAAPGQFYGYSVVQGARLLHRLLEALPGEFVAIEGLDDISVEGNGRTIAEQDKSGLAHNPVADSAIDLWKTLYNWLELIRSGALTLQTRFVLYVAQEHTGQVVKKIRDCRDIEGAENLILWLREEYWGKSPGYTKKPLNAAGLRKFLDPVLESEDEVLSTVFRQFEFVQGSGAPYDDIKALLATKAIGVEAIEPILKGLIGWTQRKVAKCIEKGTPPVISQAEFHVELHAQAQKHDRAAKELIPVERNVTAQEIEDHLREATYIKQLEIINLGNEHQIDAVGDFLRTKADLSAWAKRGHIVENSYDEYKQELLKAWRKRKAAMLIDHAGKPEEIIGQAIYLNCAQLKHPLQRMEVPDHFTTGSFHLLAHKKAVGWHPQYSDLLKATPVTEDSDVE